MTDLHTSQEKFSIMKYFRYKPTSLKQAREAENKLIEMSLSKYCTHRTQKQQQSVEISENTFINTLSFAQSDNATRNIVLCHGYGAGLGFFYRNFSLTERIANCRLIAIDWLGMGNSSRPNYPMNSKEPQKAIDFFVDSLELWRQKMKLNSFTLVGHSLGGYLGVMYALRFPERVDKLVLVSPVGVPVCTDPRNTVIGRPLPNWIHELWERNFTPQWLVRTIGPYGPEFVKRYTDARFKFLPQDESELFRNYLYHIHAGRGSGEYSLATILQPGAWARIPLYNKLSQLRMPVTFICNLE